MIFETQKTMCALIYSALLTVEMKATTVLPLSCSGEVSQLCCWLLDIAANKFSGSGCKLSLLQKDIKLAINMSDAVDQPLHVSSAVNEVRFVDIWFAICAAMRHFFLHASHTTSAHSDFSVYRCLRSLLTYLTVTTTLISLIEFLYIRLLCSLFTYYCR